MRKRESYKIFNKLNTIIAVVIVAIMGLGITYAYWSDTLTVSTKVNTGKVRVEGVLNYKQICEYPTHIQNDCPEGSNCTFKAWWQEQNEKEKIFVGNGQVDKSPINVDQLKLTSDMQQDKVTFTGTGNIVFTVKNTGDVRAEVKLNPSNDNYKKTWIKLSAPARGSVDDPGSRSTLAQGFINVNSQQMIVDKINEGQEIVVGGGKFFLNPGQEATVTLEGCKLEVYGGNDPDYDPDKLNLGEMRIEAQVSLYYQDPTGTWFDNTCNSLFMNRLVADNEVIRNGCNACNIKCKGHYEPVKMGETCGTPNLCSKPNHCNGFCPCFKNGKPNAPNNLDIIPGGEGNRPVTLPADEEDVIVGDTTNIPEEVPETEPLPNEPEQTPEVSPLPNEPEQTLEVSPLPNEPEQTLEVSPLPSEPEQTPEESPLPSEPDKIPEVAVTLPVE